MARRRLGVPISFKATSAMKRFRIWIARVSLPDAEPWDERLRHRYALEARVGSRWLVLACAVLY